MALAPRVSVKFLDTVVLPYADDIGPEIDHQTNEGWKKLTQQFPGIHIRPTFRFVSEADLKALVDRVAANNPDYHPPVFTTLFVVVCPTVAVVQHVANAIAAWPIVEFAVPQQAPSSPTGGLGGTGLNPAQGYEDPAPRGIDARCAWGVNGGDGVGQKIIDIELGWTLDHDDFAIHNPQLLFGTHEEPSRSHGTSVLGIICAANNASGLVGVAPNVNSVNVMSYSQGAGGDPALIPETIAQAVQRLDKGHVLLLEVELSFMPCEIDPQCLLAIELATAADITVVEAAGNGSQNLDTFVNAWGQQQFLRPLNGKRTRDSKAILVAGALPAVPHLKEPHSNFGSGIDCYAWAQNVSTSASANAGDRGSHTVPPEFSLTSAASAIVAGAALSVQGMVEAKFGDRLKPEPLRAVLSTIGTNSIDPIGVMPNLCEIAATLAVASSIPGIPTNVHIIT